MYAPTRAKVKLLNDTSINRAFSRIVQSSSCKTNDTNICVCYPKQNGSLRDFSNLIFSSD